jgi:hypothetical protein
MITMITMVPRPINMGFLWDARRLAGRSCLNLLGRHGARLGRWRSAGPRWGRPGRPALATS